MEQALELIRQERVRQIEKEGFKPEHDKQHEPNMLAQAAASYALDDEVRKAISRLCMPEYAIAFDAPVTWPFEQDMWKPSPDNRLKELVKAGALIVAEIERLLNTKKD